MRMEEVGNVDMVAKPQWLVGDSPCHETVQRPNWMRMTDLPEAMSIPDERTIHSPALLTGVPECVI